MSRIPTILLAGAMALAALATIGCSTESLDDVEPEVGVDAVTLKDNTFSPRVIEIAPGTGVTWTWDDGRTQHDVVSGDLFESERQSEGTFTFVFAESGSYDYECTLHGNMTGRVIVSEE